MRQHKIPRLNGTQATLLGFLAVILLGSGLLALPVSAADGHAVPYMDALFTATTSVCVTGLVTVPTFSTWSCFGQAVILLLIQIGGLGVITILSGVLITLHRRIGLGARMLIQDAFNLNTLSGMVRFVKNVILGTFAGRVRARCYTCWCLCRSMAREACGWPCSTPYRPSAMPGWM